MRAVFFILFSFIIGGLFRTTYVHAQTVVEPTPTREKIRELVSCLKEKRFTMFGSKECSACAIQKTYFGEDFVLVPYVDCSAQWKMCADKNIHAYPTWEDAEGKQYRGAIPIPVLAELSGCGSKPLLQKLQNPTVLGIRKEQLFAAFVAGLISFFAPCLVPLLPAYFSAITGFTFAELYGLDFQRLRKRVVFSTLFFIAGFTLVYTILGATGSLVGQWLGFVLPYLIRFSGLYLIILGLLQLGVFHGTWSRFDYAWNIQRRLTKLGYISSSVTGVAAGLSWIPCIGPLLSPILLLAAQSQSVVKGVILLFIYSLGITVPFLIAGFSLPTMAAKYQRNRTLLHRISLAAGVFLVLFGIILLFGQYRYYLESYKTVVSFMQQFVKDLIQ